MTSSEGFHEFQFDLQTDRAGNFYTAKASPVRAGGEGFGGGGGNGDMTAFAGTIQRISKDGRRREIYATGLRAPNGIGVGPDGQITTGDNEGTWMPACPLNWVEKGGFLGVPDSAHKTPPPPYKPPLLLDLEVLRQLGRRPGLGHERSVGAVHGRAPAPVVRAGVDLPGHEGEGGGRAHAGGDCALRRGTGRRAADRATGRSSPSSAMRARFGPRDGQLYVAGLAGWQTDAVALTGLDRVRYTGKPVYSVQGLRVTGRGVALTFTQPLAAASVTPESFSGER